MIDVAVMSTLTVAVAPLPPVTRIEHACVGGGTDVGAATALTLISLGGAVGPPTGTLLGESFADAPPLHAGCAIVMRPPLGPICVTENCCAAPPTLVNVSSVGATKSGP